jgi:hypothetical protein
VTQPIDVAYVDIVPRTKDFGKIASKELSAELKSVEKTADVTASRITASFNDAGKSINGTFRDINGRLRDARGRFAAAGDAAGNALTEGLQAATSAARTLNGSVLGIFQGLSQLAAQGPVGIAAMALAFSALATAAAIAAAAIQNLGAISIFALASLPGLIGAAIAGFGILAVALNGVVDAFQEQTKASTAGGAAAVSSARQIADAQRGIIEAQRDLVRARQDELERIQDIRRELIAARVGELRAIDNVKKAQFALDEARRIGTPRAVEEAQLNLLEANAALDEAKDKTQDLSAENAKANKVGVEGSDQVLRAQEALRDAQDRLAAAQQRVSAGAAVQMTAFNGLTASAQAFVLALVQARKDLAPLGDAIQEAFFEGTAPLVDPIVDNLLALTPEFEKVSGAFGDIFKEVLTFLGSDEAKESLRLILNGLADFLVAVTPAIGPLLEAFAGLAGQGGEFGTILGTLVKDGLLLIADVVKNVDLKALFEDAKKAVKELWPIVQDVFSILKDVFDLLVPIGRFWMPIFAGGLRILAAVFEKLDEVLTPVFTKITEFSNFIITEPGKAFDIFRDAVEFALAYVGVKFDEFRQNVSNNVTRVKSFITGIPDSLKALGSKFLDAGKNLISQFFTGLGAAGGFLANIGKDIANSFIGFINSTVIGSLNTAIRGIQDSLNKLPFFDASLGRIPNIPKLAQGGLATRNTLAEIGEGNREEAVLPLTNSRAMSRIASAIAEQGNGLGGGQINFAAGSVMVNFEGVIPTQEQAFNTGKAVADGIVRRLAARKSRIAVRTL